MSYTTYSHPFISLFFFFFFISFIHPAKTKSVVNTNIHLSTRYSDDQFEYRHVQLPKHMLAKIPVDYFDKSTGTLKLLWEEEWRALGITQVRFGARILLLLLLWSLSVYAY